MALWILMKLCRVLPLWTMEEFLRFSVLKLAERFMEKLESTDV